MLAFDYTPSSRAAATACVRDALAHPLGELSFRDFIRAWNSVFYLIPGLHPDGLFEEGSGWRDPLRALAAEAWRRSEGGEISEEQLYPSDAQWCGLYDRMTSHTPEERRRREALAIDFGDQADA